jgi:CheY-like chemotaxis protein
VELPVTSPEGSPERRAPGEGAEVARGKRILVVDDEPLVASLLVDLLTGDGHRVEVAGNGREALDRLGTADFDVIISDFRMPVLDGPTLYERQVLRDARARDRFVFITGDALAPETRRFIAQTGVLTLDKPFLPAQVRRVAQQVLRQA